MSVSLFAFLITLIFNVDFYNYKILGACNPLFAYKALQAEDKIGTMLPCLITGQYSLSLESVCLIRIRLLFTWRGTRSQRS